VTLRPFQVSPSPTADAGVDGNRATRGRRATAAVTLSGLPQSFARSERARRERLRDAQEVAVYHAVDPEAYLLATIRSARRRLKRLREARAAQMAIRPSSSI
jgi:5-formyltetrahydrofolate cyclo-ligase